MAKKKYTFDYQKMIDWRIGKLMSDDDIDRMEESALKNDDDTLQELWDKYEKEIVEEEPQVEEEPEEEPVVEDKAEQRKAVLAYKSVSRMLRFRVMKEEVLLDHDHTCICCDKSFPTREEWTAEKKKERYPLYVRCHFPLIKYIEKKGQFDPKQLATDPKIFDKKHYSAICEDCKPLSFKRK